MEDSEKRVLSQKLSSLNTMNKLLLSFAISILLLIGIGLAYEQTSRQKALDTYKAKGSLVDLGSRDLHIDCRGKGSPIVVLEAGLDTMGSLSWSAIHDELAKTTRVCAYDRAGIMWSDPRPNTDNLMADIAHDLNKGLTLAEELPPYILVGHSFGGPYITKFTELYADKVKGIVFVDSPHPEQMDLVQDIEIPLMPSLVNKVQNFLSPVFNNIGLTRLIHSPSSTFPNQPEYDSEAIAVFYPSSENTLTKEIANYSTGLKQVDALRNFADRPMFVLGNIVNYPDMTDQQLLDAGITRAIVPAVMEQDLYMFNDQASWSSDGELKLFHNTSHYIQFDKPNEVLSAIRVVVNKIKIKEGK